mgnify:CR=1 FL=1
MSDKAKLLEIQPIVDAAYPLGVAQTAWQSALAKAPLDPLTNIRHAVIDGGTAESRTHVAAIPERVKNHVHFEGREDYAVVGGKGRLHWGKVVQNEQGQYSVPQAETPVVIEAGHIFVIPNGYAHQLERVGNEDLTILFNCPDSHLNNDLDRVMLPDAPTLKL